MLHTPQVVLWGRVMVCELVTREMGSLPRFTCWQIRLSKTPKYFKEFVF
jgi:hypothetical protein